MPARDASVAGIPRLGAQNVVCREPGVLAGEAPAAGPSCPGTPRGGPVYRGAEGAGPCGFGSRHTQTGTHLAVSPGLRAVCGAFAAGVDRGYPLAGSRFLGLPEPVAGGFCARQAEREGFRGWVVQRHCRFPGDPELFVEALATGAALQDSNPRSPNPCLCRAADRPPVTHRRFSFCQTRLTSCSDALFSVFQSILTAYYFLI